MFTNSKPFGSASTFGTSSFGTTSSPFGQSNTAFGAKPAGNNVFGSSAFGTSTPSTGGLFGTTTPSTGTSMFGQPSTAFGQPASTSGGSFGFGSTSTTGGLFGTNTQSTQSSSLFGNTATSAFGTPRPTFGGFGTTTAGTSLFGQSTSTGTGLFGGSTGFSSATNGTTIKFNPPTGTDTMMKGGVSTNISTRHQCITCMKEYENKSLEELRVEDYAANRKGPQSGGMSGFGATGQTGLFGQPAASTSAFSFGGTTQSKPLFGTTGTNTFGTGTNLFGQTSQSQNTSMFNKPVGFGAATTSAGGAFSFGNMSNTSTFGQNSFQKPFGQTGGGSGLFGTTTTTQPSTAFGTGTAFGFGTSAPQSTGLFGTKPTGFGSTNTTTTSTFTFGTPSNVSGGGLFGNKSNVSAFGTGTTSFGTPSTGMGVFGTTQTSSSGLFGANKPTTGFGTGFGSGLGTNFGTSLFSSNMSTNAAPGLFGSSTANKSLGFSFTGINAGSTTGGFGQPNVGNPSLGFGSSAGFGVGSDPNASALMQQQYQAQQQILALASNPFGDSPLFRNPIKETNKREELLKPTNPAAQKAVLSNNQYKVSPLPSAKIKPKPIPLIPNGKVSLFDGLDDEDVNLANMTFVPKKSVKKLIIKPKMSPHTPSLTVTSNISTTAKPNEIILSTSVHVGKPDSRDGVSQAVTPAMSPIALMDDPGDKLVPLERADSQSPDSHRNLKKLSENVVVRNLNSSLDDTFAALHTHSPKHQGRSLGISLDSETSTPCKEMPSDDPVLSFHEHCQGDILSNPIGVVLTRPGYYTIPALDELLKMTDKDGNCNVENFTVGHDKYGKVCFPGVTNVAGLNLDEIVHFRPKEITVYPDDNNKPPEGEGLNRKAEVTLDCVWPTDKTTHTPIKDPERLALIGYQEKIEKATKRLNAKFIEYRPETGSWVFQVLHFSKYGLEESDDEYEDVQKVPETNNKIAVPVSKAQKVMPKVNGHSPLEADILKQSQMKKHVLRLTDLDDEMEDLSSQTLLKESDITEDDGLTTDFHINTQQLASVLGIRAERIQGMKASFFHDDMEDNWGVSLETKGKDSISDLAQMKILRAAEQGTPQSPATPSRLQLSKRNTSLLMQDSVDIAPSPATPLVSVPLLNEVARNEAYIAARNEILSSYPLVQPLLLPQEGVPMETSVSGASRKLALKSFGTSLTYGKQKKLADMGYFMGRRFRTGWGPNWTLSYLGESHPSQSATAKPDSIFRVLSRPPTVVAQQFSALNVSIGRLQLMSDLPLPVDNLIRNHLQESLEIQLENAAVATEDGAPTFVPKCGVQSLHHQAELSRKHLDQTDVMHVDHDFIKQCSNVWELCVCLWGNIPGLDQEQEISSYAQQMARREALTKWLIKTSKDTILSEINNSKDRKDYLSALFCHLTGKQISEACHLALDSYDHRLALLLSQAGVNYIVKKLINKQLMNWEQNKADKFISKGRLKLYALLAGTLVWHASESVVNCCEDLDWKRSLALHLWYQCHPSSSVQDAVAQYENAFQGSGDQGKYAQPPYPPYIEKSELLSDLLMASEDTEQSEPLYDTCFYLLKLYCDRSQRLDKLLMPGASTPAHLDHRLSWVLYQSLSALGYEHLSTDVASALHCNFASQLETMDMWHWAAFVLLHIPDAQRRTKCVKELLLRHLPLNQSEENQERETFLHKNLKIPNEWIFEAKAIKARFLGHPAEEAWFLLKAGLWSKSHTIVTEKLAPDAIINENYDYLLSYLKELSPPERSSTILNWSTGGQVFLDYIHISQTVEHVIKGEVSAYDLEKLHPQLVTLCRRLSSIRCSNARDRLCQAEMAKKTATLLRAVYTLQQARAGNKASVYTLAPHIKNLPMPEDYTLQEMRAMARGYMQAVALE